MKKIERLTMIELSYKIKIAKIFTALHENIRDGVIVDTMFMGKQQTCPNETVYDFLMEQLEDVIDFEFDDENNYSADIVLAEEFIDQASKYLKKKMSI